MNPDTKEHEVVTAHVILGFTKLRVVDLAGS